MKVSVLLLSLAVASSPSVANPVRRQASDIGGLVNTTIGQVQGTASRLRPAVSAYLGIPFAQPPIGDLRFAAPVPVSRAQQTVDATNYGPDCPSNRIPANNSNLAGAVGEKLLEALGQVGDASNEDCLSINVWTKPQSGEAKKAVLFWIYGGGFSIGNTASAVYDGSVLADENDVVVVSPNYRLNIFGFAQAPGGDTNVGLLDQRLALEWTRDNIAAFGGDPGRITVFGQSAGGASTDLLAYGYPDDPIAHALIPESGEANGVVTGAQTVQDVQVNWYKASQSLGCGGPEAGNATLACMRTKSTDQLLQAIVPLGVSGLMSGFNPAADGKVVPNNVSANAAAGNFAKIPILTGSTSDEASLFVLLAFASTDISADTVARLNPSIVQPLLDIITLIDFTCPATQAVQYRLAAKVPVWHYQYFGGNYSNTYLVPFGSAYHTSELPIVFGTASAVTGVADSAVEATAACHVRTAWTSFAKDPVNGLTNLGWPQAGDSGNNLVRLSYQDETSPSFISNSQNAGLCSVVADMPSLGTEIQGLLTEIIAINVVGIDQGYQKDLALVRYATLINETHNDPDSFRTFLQGLLQVAAIINGTANATTTG